MIFQDIKIEYSDIDFENENDKYPYILPLYKIFDMILDDINSKGLLTKLKIIILSNILDMIWNELEANFYQLNEFYEAIYNLAFIGFIHKDVHLNQFGINYNRFIKFYEFDGKIEVKTIVRENKTALNQVRFC